MTTAEHTDLVSSPCPTCGGPREWVPPNVETVAQYTIHEPGYWCCERCTNEGVV